MPRGGRRVPRARSGWSGPPQGPTASIVPDSSGNLFVATFAQWAQGARPRTLPMAIAPVIVGSAAAYGLGSFKLLNAVLAALVAVMLQVGVNYANVYSD